MKRLFASAVTVAIIWVACGGSADSQALAAATSAWQTASIDSYSFVYSRTCECDDVTRAHKRVDVVDGQVVSVSLLEGSGDRSLDPAQYGYTIDRLLELIGSSVDAGVDNDLEFAELGYPTVMMLDLEEMAMDGGFGLWLHEFDVGPA